MLQWMSMIIFQPNQTWNNLHPLHKMEPNSWWRHCQLVGLLREIVAILVIAVISLKVARDVSNVDSSVTGPEELLEPTALTTASTSTTEPTASSTAHVPQTNNATLPRVQCLLVMSGRHCTMQSCNNIIIFCNRKHSLLCWAVTAWHSSSDEQ